ncbi:hypothetical protein JCM9492_10560 [Aquifex pyrophilus]
MEKIKEVAKFTEDYLKNYCTKLEKKEENNKFLFFCHNYLIGSVVLLDDEKVATTVYSSKIGDEILRNFLKKVKERFNGEVIEQGIKMSGVLNENFYYAYNWISL